MKRVIACAVVWAWPLAASLAAQSVAAVKPVDSELAVYSPSTPIGFENTSEQPVNFHWRLFADRTSCGSTTPETIAPKGRLYLLCSLDPRPGWWTTGALKPGKGDAVLRVASSPVSSITACAECVDHKVVATIAYYSRSTQTVGNVATLLTLLVVGGLFSHWITTTLPNLRRKERLRTQLLRLRWDIRWTAADLDNELPSRLAVERSRLTDQLASQPSWGNDTADVLTSIETELAPLRQQAVLLDRVVAARDRLRRVATTLFRRLAIDAITRPLLAKLANATSVDQTASLSDQLAGLTAPSAGERDPEFEAWCMDRAAALQSVIKAVLEGSAASLPRLRVACEALSTAVEPRAYADRELCFLKLLLLERFQRLPAATPGDDESQSWLAQLDAAEQESALGALNRALVERESKQRLQDVCASLTADDIRIYPAGPRSFEPAVVEFKPGGLTRRRLQRFEDEGLLRLRWAFCKSAGGSPPQWRRLFGARGAVVRCYFPDAGTYQVSLQVGGPEDAQPKELTCQVTVRRSRSRVTAQFGTQALRLFGAQLIAATAAFLGAWDMLLERDVAIAVVAALAMGYGTDTIKSAGAALVDRLKGSDRSTETKKAELARTSANLDE